jgi:hypothetical protein
MPFEFRRLDTQTPEVVVEQVGLGIESHIFDLPDGRTLYVVWLSLTAETPGTCLYDYRFVPPWPDRGFQSLPSFADSHIGEAYVLPGEWDCPREDVLNFRFGKTGWRLSLTPIEGALCALSTTPIPEEFTHGDPVRIEVKFFGKAGQQLAAANVVMCADRWREPAATRPTARPPIEVDTAEPSVAPRPRRSTLYDGPPPELTASERCRAEYLRITFGERGNTLSDRPSPSWQGLPVHGFKQAEPSREEED